MKSINCRHKTTEISKKNNNETWNLIDFLTKQKHTLFIIIQNNTHERLLRRVNYVKYKNASSS